MFTTKKILIIIIKNSIISLVFVGIISFAIFLIKNEIVKITDSVVLNKKLGAQLKERTELISTLKHDAKIIGQNNILIKEAFISSENISPFIDELDKLGAEVSVDQTYRFETPKPSGLHGPFPISSIYYSNNITTELSSLLGYLKKFENIPYFTKIESITISSQDKTLGWLGQSNILLKTVLLTKTTE